MLFSLFGKEEKITKLTTVRMAIYASRIIIAHTLTLSVAQERKKQMG
jgi:hypothetical protein